MKGVYFFWIFHFRGQASQTAGSSRSFTVIRKDAGLYCGPRLRKGEVFAYVGLPQNLKDLKDLEVVDRFGSTNIGALDF